jgi:hypothetical protein
MGRILLCFLPLAIIFFFTKLALLLLETAEEIDHVRDESQKPHKYMDDVYADIDREKESDRDW